MKPLELKMQAFGAYIKPVVLNFEENLRDEKIFLIHGATGSGKTTILDAICFALYGTASGDERDGAMMRSKGIDDKTLTAVEFKFKLGEKIYKVRRELISKSDKITQNAELIYGGRVIANKKSNVTNTIKEILGFDAEQFRQVVLLPQGEFKTFLTAKADDRQPILNALFNAEFYRQVEDALKIKCDAAQNDFVKLTDKKSALESQLQGARSDAAAVSELRADLAVEREKSTALKKIFDKAQDKFADGKKLADDFAELERRNKLLGKSEGESAQAEKIFFAAKVEYDNRTAEQVQRDKLKFDLDTLNKIKKAVAELESKQKEFSDAEKTLQTATAEVTRLEKWAEDYAKLLEKREKRREELSGAEKKLADAETVLETLKEISRLEKELENARQKALTADKNFKEAQLKVERLQKLQREGSAILLAKNLKDGEPCPVCGSRVHYAVDFGEAIIPSDKEIDSAQIKADNLKKIFDDAKNFVATIEGQILTQKNNLKKFDGVPTIEIAQKNYLAAQNDKAELDDCQRRITKGNRLMKNNNDALKVARDNYNAASNRRFKYFGEVQACRSQIPEKYSSDSGQLDADIKSNQKILGELEDAWKIADKNYRDAVKIKSAREATLESARASQKELADKLKDKTPPELATLKTQAEESQKNYIASIEKVTSLKNSLDNLEKVSAQIYELDKKILQAEKSLRIWRKLSDVASGKIPGKRISFVRYYLRAMFEQVLTEANYRLAKMSDRRYWFKQKDAGKVKNSTAGLNLEIFDEYTGEARPVATLSGGESFLASLSLALGLAAVVRNNSGGIKLDTIFIDEGFGTLDSETLDFAMKTLIELQSGGRLVGIISHVEELKNQMPVRLEVKKTKTGSTAEFKGAC